MKNKYPMYFSIIALLSLVGGLLFGLLGGLQYILPNFCKEILPFTALRPLHTLFVVSWILVAAIGGIYYYINTENQLSIRYPALVKAHFWLFVLTGVGIAISYFRQDFGGKEYLEFPSYFYFPIVLGWIAFGINYYKSVTPLFKNWPAYYWMWATGIGFMIYHFTEAHLWMLPYFRSHYIQNLAMQWKAGGSYVGSWNMLVYGTALFVMAKISQDESYATSKKAFFFYFLGLTNLMFGWAHHIYVIPTAPWIRYIAYAISMTEWIVLFSIIRDWKNKLSETQKQQHSLAYTLLILADVWVFLNLFLALLISIPAINLFTHGTHITVAHSMGTTIGINTFILLASITYIIESNTNIKLNLRRLKRWILLANGSFIGFWLILLIMGVKKGYWTYCTPSVLFSQFQEAMQGIYIVFVLFGIGILIGLSGYAIELILKLKALLKTTDKPN
jgi:nitric oxide reductase subunit B